VLGPDNQTLRTLSVAARPLVRFGHNWVLDTAAEQFRRSEPRQLESVAASPILLAEALIVVEVTYTEVTAAGTMRRPVLIAVRADVSAEAWSSAAKLLPGSATPYVEGQANVCDAIGTAAQRVQSGAGVSGGQSRRHHRHRRGRP
jgi:hypothetical protein